MVNITSEHLKHMAQRHHATMKKLDGLTEKVRRTGGRLIGSVETGAGAWIGGAIEGRTGGGTVPVLRIPINLGIGFALLLAGHTLASQDPANPANRGWGGWGDHLDNIGNGFLSSYVAATGYSFGKRWRETGSAFGGGGNTWTHPYQVDGGPPTAVHGDLNEGQIAAIVHQMHVAAAAPARP